MKTAWLGLKLHKNRNTVSYRVLGGGGKQGLMYNHFIQAGVCLFSVKKRRNTFNVATVLAFLEGGSI